MITVQYLHSYDKCYVLSNIFSYVRIAISAFTPDFMKCKGELHMSKGIGSKSTWVLIMLVLIGAVLGSFIGNLAAGSSLSWLNYGKTFGLTSPIVLDMAVLTLTFGLTIHFSIATILGIILAILIYRFI